MKKTWIVLSLIALLAMLFASAQVTAQPADGPLPKHTPDHTPGAQATQNATDGNTHGKGNGNGQGKPQGGGESHGKPANYQGVIFAVDPASLTLTLQDAATVTFVISSDTQIKLPTLGKTATVDALKVGMKANVHAMKDDAGVLTAKTILVVPGKPALMHRVGVVNDYQAGVSITIQTSDGSTFTYLITATTKVLPAESADQLAVGAEVTIVMPRDVTGGEPTAKAIVIHLPEEESPSD